MKTFELGNLFLVGARGPRIVILRPAIDSMTEEDAVNLAAWLVTLTGVSLEEFGALVRTIRAE